MVFYQSGGLGGRKGSSCCFWRQAARHAVFGDIDQLLRIWVSTPEAAV